MTRLLTLSGLGVALVLAGAVPAVASSACDEDDARREPAGERDRPIRWQAAKVTRGGRTLLITVHSGIFRPNKVVIREGARSVIVTILEPQLKDESLSVPQVGVVRCVRVRLHTPLGERRLFDGRAPRKRRVARETSKEGRGCLRLRTIRR